MVAPSDKINLACVGTGTEGLREMPVLLASEDIRITAVCDPNRDAGRYRDWSRDGLLRDLRRASGRSELAGRDGGHDSRRARGGPSVVEAYYAGQSRSGQYKGCAAYADAARCWKRKRASTRSRS